MGRSAGEAVHGVEEPGRTVVLAHHALDGHRGSDMNSRDLAAPVEHHGDLPGVVGEDARIQPLGDTPTLE